MKLRGMTAAELAAVLGWAATEGWNPGLDDAAAFHATDPDGFFVAEVDGAPVAAISVVRHGADFAFLGLYICRPDHRGRGIGKALWDHALAHAGTRTVGLDGVPAQQENYRRSGFVAAGRTDRFAGPLPAVASGAVRGARTDERPVLCDLETAANGYAKPGFLAAWLADTATRRTLVLDRGAGAEGFATLRRCIDGYKIGPLVARDIAGAETLLTAAGVATFGAPVMIDVPSDMAALAALCRGWDMSVPFDTARMYRGTPPAPGTGIRAVATLELG